jgi:DNA-directed RNA polymerase subunit delta
VEEKADDWDKVEEEENWDPDFEEFDLPKSKAKKTTAGGKKAAADDEDDFKVDDEFKDMFNDSDGFGDDEDDL